MTPIELHNVSFLRFSVNLCIVVFLCFANWSHSVGRLYSSQNGSYDTFVTSDSDTINLHLLGDIVKARRVRDVESIHKQAKEQSDAKTNSGQEMTPKEKRRLPKIDRTSSVTDFLFFLISPQ
uniref:Uncharacterized protein n=1 Tax=Romanomermis culicivorax TaxID=13658 RepID=A0A915IX77_ROMCU